MEDKIHKNHIRPESTVSSTDFEAELHREIDLLLYAISHDLRAPLRAVVGFSEALKEDYEELLDDDGRDFLQRIYRAGLQLNDSIDAILYFSRMTRQHMNWEPIELHLLARQAAEEPMAAVPDHDIELVIQPDLHASGDRMLLSELLRQLFSNAFKFRSADERLRVEFGAQPNRHPTVYYMRDNGIGFDMTYADKRLFGLFQRMHTGSQYSGMGVGLAIARRIVNRHGGRIWAESGVNQGTTVFFTLTQDEDRS